MFFVSAREAIEERRRSQEDLLDPDGSSSPNSDVQIRLLAERKNEWER